MDYFDVILDACVFISGIAGMIYVIIMRKHFDLSAGLLTCAAWVIKGIRILGYDWFVFTMKTTEVHSAFLFSQKTALFLNGCDVLINALLIIALARLILLGLFFHWYNKAKKAIE